jgi:hypothetical protein
MAILRSPVFIVCLIIFIIHQVLQKVMDIHFERLDNYLDNLLAMPVILTLLLAERRWLFKKGDTYTLPALDIGITMLYVISTTEIVFPLFSKEFTGDWVDVFFYAAGAVLFHYTINRLPKSKSSF